MAAGITKQVVAELRTNVLKERDQQLNLLNALQGKLSLLDSLENYLDREEEMEAQQKAAEEAKAAEAEEFQWQTDVELRAPPADRFNAAGNLITDVDDAAVNKAEAVDHSQK